MMRWPFYQDGDRVPWKWDRQTPGKQELSPTDKSMSCDLLKTRVVLLGKRYLGWHDDEVSSSILSVLGSVQHQDQGLTNYISPVLYTKVTSLSSIFLTSLVFNNYLLLDSFPLYFRLLSSTGSRPNCSIPLNSEFSQRDNPVFFSPFGYSKGFWPFSVSYHRSCLNSSLSMAFRTHLYRDDTWLYLPASELSPKYPGLHLHLPLIFPFWCLIDISNLLFPKTELIFFSQAYFSLYTLHKPDHLSCRTYMKPLPLTPSFLPHSG